MERADRHGTITPQAITRENAIMGIKRVNVGAPAECSAFLRGYACVMTGLHYIAKLDTVGVGGVFKPLGDRRMRNQLTRTDIRIYHLDNPNMEDWVLVLDAWCTTREGYAAVQRSAFSDGDYARAELAGAYEYACNTVLRGVKMLADNARDGGHAFDVLTVKVDLEALKHALPD